MIWTLALLAACGKGSVTADDSAAASSGTHTVADTGAGGTEDLSAPRDCATVFRYTATYPANGVYLAASFNDWSDTEAPMEEVEPGVFELRMELAPGAYTYKFIEKTGSAYWVCDADARYMQCDEGYDSSSWDDCRPGASSCNSMVVVEDCAPPLLHLTGLEIDRDADTARLELAFQPGAAGDGMAEVAISVNGEPIAADWDNSSPSYTLELSGLGDGRYAVRVEATDAAGLAAEPLYVPFWTDDRSWERGLLYYVFVDRFADGDSGLNGSEGTAAWATDYQGGDWRGVIDRLDYLEELGVTALWLTAPQDNPAGAWGWDCEANFSGYHGYWPSSPSAVEGHFGDEAVLRELIAAAHARGMRVIVDWVANHVHQDHPYYRDHPDWFADSPALCDDYNNWNDIPETCWFDSFLPDIRYYETGPLQQMVDDAITWAMDYDLDGYRVDAVKHMPRALYYNLQSRVAEEIEHRSVGGDEEFYTVGETFDGDRGLLASYIGADQLDAQFDFPLYFTLRSTFIAGGATLRDLEASFAESEGAYGGALMSTFLGNHDVERFVSVAAEGEQGVCNAEGLLNDPAQPPAWDEPYRRLRLAWTWLLTHRGLPLIYYGDELGMPGYQDPDNRQFMRFEGLSADEQATLDHVRALGRARRSYPQLALGESTTWWEEDWVYARALSYEDQHALVVINLSWDDRTLSNGLSWAGLPEGTWTDVLTGERLTSSGDSLDVTVPAMSSVVLIRT